MTRAVDVTSRVNMEVRLRASLHVCDVNSSSRTGGSDMPLRQTRGERKAVASGGSTHEMREKVGKGPRDLASKGKAAFVGFGSLLPKMMAKWRP